MNGVKMKIKKKSLGLLYFCGLIFYTIDFCTVKGWIFFWEYFFKSWFYLSYLVYQGSLKFIIYFYFPILKELMFYVCLWFISTNNNLLVAKCYSFLVVSGFSRNEFIAYILFNFCCWIYLFLFDVRFKGH